MNHTELINIAHCLGYNKSITPDGLCRGFTGMWIQAVCLGDLSNFSKRLNFLDQFKDDPQELQYRIAQTREKLRSVQGIKALSEKEQLLIEIPAFYAGIALYLNPLSNNDFFGNRTLTQLNAAEISSYTQSKRLEASGGLGLTFRTTDQYTQIELEQYLKNIDNELGNKKNIAIDFSANSHSIAARALGNDKFQLVDTNNLDKIGKTYTSKELAKKLNKYFSNQTRWYESDKPLLLTTSIFTKNASLLPLDHLRNKKQIAQLVTNKYDLNILEQASLTNDTATLMRIDFNKNNVNQASTPQRLIPLAAAASANATEAAEFLLTIPNIDVNSSNNLPPAINAAIHQKNFSLAKKILDHHSFIPATSHFYGNPLHAIAQIKIPDDDNELATQVSDFAKELLHKGININEACNQDNTPIYEACKAGNLQLVNLFLENGANLNVLNKENISTLHAAAYSGNVDLVKMLIEKGVKPNQQNYHNETPLHFACANGHIEVVALLLEHNAELDVTTLTQKTPLHFACSSGNDALVSMLLKTGQITNLNKVTTYNASPLHFACMNGDPEVVKALLAHSPDCNIRTDKGLRPLDLACQNNHPELISLLLETTKLTMNDFHPDSGLMRSLPYCNSEIQRDIIKKALETYIAERSVGAEYLNPLNLGFSKDEKVKAAQALIDNINGKAGDLTIHLKALNQGALSSFYKLYDRYISQPALETNQKKPDYSYTTMATLFNLSSPPPVVEKEPQKTTTTTTTIQSLDLNTEKKHPDPHDKDRDKLIETEQPMNLNPFKPTPF